MSKVKDYLKLKADRNVLDLKITGSKGERDRLIEDLEPLEEESLKAEILATPDFEEKRAALKDRREKITRMKAEAEADKKKLKVMDDLLLSFQQRAGKELASQYKEVFEKSIKSFVKKIKIAYEAEIELEKIREKAIEEFAKIDNARFCPFVERKYIFMRTRQYPGSLREWEEQIERWKNEGYKID